METFPIPPAIVFQESIFLTKAKEMRSDLPLLQVSRGAWSNTFGSGYLVPKPPPSYSRFLSWPTLRLTVGGLSSLASDASRTLALAGRGLSPAPGRHELSSLYFQISQAYPSTLWSSTPPIFHRLTKESGKSCSSSSLMAETLKRVAPICTRYNWQKGG